MRIPDGSSFEGSLPFWEFHENHHKKPAMSVWPFGWNFGLVLLEALDFPLDPQVLFAEKCPATTGLCPWEPWKSTNRFLLTSSPKAVFFGS